MLQRLRSPKCITYQKDRGYAWCILVMSFLSHGCHLGFSFAVLGNLTIAHNKLFNYQNNEANTIGSVHNGLFFLLAPIATVLMKKTGCQLTEIVGGCFLILGMALSSITTHPWQAYLFFSVFCGWGLSCTYIATSEILAQHFDRFKYLCFALAVFGYYVGMVVWPVVSQNLLDQYGYHTAMGIMSLIHIVHIVAGILFFSPPNEGVAPSTTEVKITDSENAAEKSQKDSTQDSSQPQMTLAQAFLSLLKMPTIWALLFNCLLWNFTTTSFFILVNNFMKSKIGISEAEAALGITIIGILNLVGTAAVVGLGRLTYDRLILHVCASTLYCSMVVIMAFTSSKMMFYVLAGFWGLGQGALIANLLGVVYDFCGADQLSVLFGIILLFEGVGGLVGAPLCEYIGRTHGYQYSLVTSGLAGLIGTVVILPVLVQRCKNNRAKKNAPKKQQTDNKNIHQEQPLL